MFPPALPVAPVLLPTYTVLENVEIALAPKDYSKKEVARLVIPLFEQFRMMDKLKYLPEELSLGQQQKVAIIRTLAKQPFLILADEPTASVDEENGNEIIAYLKELSTKKMVTMIVATHGILNESCADRVLTLEDGRLL